MIYACANALPSGKCTHGALISACERGKQPERAFSISENMQQQGVVPNLVTYSTVISACKKGKQFEWALEIFDGMPEHRSKAWRPK